ncbi:MAG: tetratricopeptide repeat protein [Gemmatimonadaceae bacterium]
MLTRQLRRAARMTPLAVLAAICVFPSALNAQSLPINTSIGPAPVSGCTTVSERVAVNSARSNAEELRTFINRAQEASLVGDHVVARDSYRSAVAIAPLEPRLTYYLGREYEALNDGSAAVQTYCRYLALAPTSADADEVRGRIARLTPASEIEKQGAVLSLFQSAVILLARGDFVAADSLLTEVARINPSPAVYYDRGLARAARGARDSAMADFKRYMAATPSGADHAAINRALAALPRHVYSPGRSLRNGLIFPGVGQVATRRPLLGLVALGALGGALTLALQWTQEYQLVAQRDGQGRLSADSVLVTVHPTAALGYSLAAATWLGAALESYAYARRTHSASAGIIERSATGVPRFIVQPLLGARTGVGLEFTW